MNIPKEGVKRRILTPDDGYDYFFGYYDLPFIDSTDRYHLLHRVKHSFMDGLPTKDDVAELGYVDTKTGEVTIFAETTAWNFQQGAMLQWNLANPDEEVIFNIRDGEEFRAVTLNLKTGKRKVAERAVANVSPDGKWGLSVNMSRIYDFRPGYGYSDVPDKFADVPQPDNDGIYLVNMETGKAKLIVDYARIMREFPTETFKDAKFVVNHITFNTASNRFLFLLRNFKTETVRKWSTWLYTSDLEGNLYPLLSETMVSHYHWKDEKTILGYLRYDGNDGVFELEDLTHNGVDLRHPLYRWDIHTIYSPDRRYFIGDDYPDQESNRHIYIHDFKTGQSEELFKEFSKAPPIGDNRCDLHNRWTHDGRKITYDSTHRGKRDICELDVSFLYEE